MITDAEITAATKVLKRHFHKVWEDTTWRMVARQVLMRAEDARLVQVASDKGYTIPTRNDP